MKSAELNIFPRDRCMRLVKALLEALYLELVTIRPLPDWYVIHVLFSF